MTSNAHSTEAEYYRQGLSVGVASSSDVTAWADRIVRGLPNPPAEIIDVAFARSEEELISKLKEVNGEPDLATVSGLLYHALHCELISHPSRVQEICDKAVSISRSESGSDDVYFSFVHIEDDLELIRVKAAGAGNIDRCVSDLLDALCKYAIDPESTELSIRM